MLPPAVTVHGPADARRALAPGLPVTLLSAEGAACFAGCAWWRALVDRARAEAPGVEAPDVLDCADAPGRAVEALRAGCRWIVLAPSCPAFADVVARAESSGAVVLAARPAALDLRPTRRGHDPARGLEAWLRRDRYAPLG